MTTPFKSKEKLRINVHATNAADNVQAKDKLGRIVHAMKAVDDIQANGVGQTTINTGQRSEDVVHPKADRAHDVQPARGEYVMQAKRDLRKRAL